MEENNNPAPTQSNNDINIWESTPSTPPVSNEPVVENKQTEVSTDTTVVTPEVPATEIKKEEPVITEKVVEKIIEKYPEFKDDYSKQLYEAIRNGKENDLYDYLQRKNKDYEVMSDIDVVKEKLKFDNPTWTSKDVEMELKFKFGTLPAKKDLSAIDKDIDPDAYDKAVEFNDAVDQKELLLTREARDARLALNETKKNIEFPKIQDDPVEPTKELTQDEVDELNQKWEQHVTEEMPKLSDFKFQIGDEEVSYKITEEERAAQTDYMKGFTGEKVAKDLGWIDENGNENVVKIAEDMLFLRNKQKIVASMATQMKTKATKEVVAEIKNVDLNNPSPVSTEVNQDVGKMIWS